MFQITYTATHLTTSLIQRQAMTVKANSETAARFQVAEHLRARGYIFVTTFNAIKVGA